MMKHSKYLVGWSHLVHYLLLHLKIVILLFLWYKKLIVFYLLFWTLFLLFFDLGDSNLIICSTGGPSEKFRSFVQWNEDDFLWMQGRHIKKKKSSILPSMIFAVLIRRNFSILYFHLKEVNATNYRRKLMFFCVYR